MDPEMRIGKRVEFVVEISQPSRRVLAVRYVFLCVADMNRQVRGRRVFGGSLVAVAQLPKSGRDEFLHQADGEIGRYLSRGGGWRLYRVVPLPGDLTVSVNSYS